MTLLPSSPPMTRENDVVTQGACPLVDAATPSSDAAATTTAVDKTDHLRRPPRGEPAGGRWFVESNDDDDDDGQENVQHVPSGLVMKLSGRLLYFHPVQENMYWNIHGQPVDTSVLADKKLLRELHVDLIPILPQKTSSSSSSPGVDNDDDDDDDDDDVVELDDSNECRPVGTLAGGTWFLETNGDPTTVDRWLYRESDRVYYTREGIRVIPDPESTLRPIKRIVNGKVATQQTQSTGKVSSPKQQQQQQQQQQQGSTAAPLARGPPGTRPGGVWYRQTYRGPRTQDRQVAACCLWGPDAAMMVSYMALDERCVYHCPHSHRFFTVHGLAIDPTVGTLTPMPPRFHPMGVVGDGTENSGGGGAGNGSVAREAVRRSSTNPKEGDDTTTFVPPGCPPGGLWYSQLHRGRNRLVYRTAPHGPDFVDRSGRPVDPRAGPMQPPLQYHYHYY